MGGEKHSLGGLSYSNEKKQKKAWNVSVELSMDCDSKYAFGHVKELWRMGRVLGRWVRIFGGIRITCPSGCLVTISYAGCRGSDHVG